jgi:hypothetical protein
MSDLAIDTSGDIKVTEGDVSRTTGIDAIRQHLEIRLRAFRGEWFLDERIGVPYFDNVFKKNPDLTVLNAVFTKAILDTPGVNSLNSLTFELVGRQLNISFSALTDEGVLDYSGFVGV